MAKDNKTKKTAGINAKQFIEKLKTYRSAEVLKKVSSLF